MVNAYFSLGSNLGGRKGNLNRAILLLGEIEGVKIRKVSSFYETEPVGAEGGRFINCAVKAEVAGMDARELLQECLKIEEKMGRERKTEKTEKGMKKEARVIDVDLLIFGNERIDEENLKIPHPRMKERLFVLIPLQEIAAGIKIDGEKIADLIERAEKKEVTKLSG